MPSFWPANTVEMLTFLQCRQSRPQAVMRCYEHRINEETDISAAQTVASARRR
jgi:hypothetical protein